MTDMSNPVDHRDHLVGGYDRNARIWVLTMCGLGGALLGLLLPLVAAWAASLPWLPFQGPVRLLGSFDQTWLVWGRPAIGLIAGLGLGAWIILDSPVLNIRSSEVQVQRRGQVERVIPREKVEAVYWRKPQLVIKGPTEYILFEEQIDGNKHTIRDAFVEAGFPWEGQPG